MVDLIEIKIINGIVNIYDAIFDYNENYCIINDRKRLIKEETKDSLLRIIRTWRNEYGSSSVIDAEEFIITIHTSSNDETLHGKGVFPNNYDELLSFLGDLYG